MGKYLDSKGNGLTPVICISVCLRQHQAVHRALTPQRAEAVKINHESKRLCNEVEAKASRAASAEA